MKKMLLKGLILLPLLLSMTCENDPISGYEPEIMPRAQFEKTTKLIPNPQGIVNSGKIYLKDNFLFVNEKDKGFHIFDNSDISNPKNLMFLQVLGATDMAIKNDVIFTNNSTDLIALTINQNTKELKIEDRIKNAFPQKQSPDGFEHNTTSDEIIITWNKK